MIQLTEDLVIVSLEGDRITYTYQGKEDYLRHASLLRFAKIDNESLVQALITWSALPF